MQKIKIGVTRKNFYTNERHIHENGFYIYLKPDKWNDFGYITMFVFNKKNIIEELKKLGFNEYSLLPDMEHCANYVKSLEKDIKE